jgi:hypothetical protein
LGTSDEHAHRAGTAGLEAAIDIAAEQSREAELSAHLNARPWQRTHVATLFPNQDLLLGLVTAVVGDIDDDRDTGKSPWQWNRRIEVALPSAHARPCGDIVRDGKNMISGDHGLALLSRASGGYCRGARVVRHFSNFCALY